MVVLAPGAEIRAADIPPDILEGPGSLLPVRIGYAGRGRDMAGGQELEFILRSLLDLKLQVEELRRRLDEHPQRVQVIELGDHAHAWPTSCPTATPATATRRWSTGAG